MENGVKGLEFQDEPRDTYKIAYIIHFLLGAGNLLPWNAFITAVDYFGYLYPTKHVEKVFSVAYMSSSVLVLVVMMTWGCWWERMSPRLRLNLGFLMFILSLTAAPIIDWASCHSTNAAYGVTVASVVICGLADGLVGGSLMGSAGKLPKKYMQAVFAGTASSGVIICVLRISTKAMLPQTPKGLKTSAHLYFIVSIIILLCCILCSNLLYKLRVMQEHCRLVQDQSFCCSPRPKFWAVARKIPGPAFGMFIIYTVTLSIFPGFIAENLESKLLQDWYPILLITVYNFADLVGKSLTAIYLLKSIKKATWACVTRLIFYPIFTACLHGPTWLKTEVPMIFLTFMLGLSNGYLTSAIMMTVPKLVPVPEAELSAIVMVVFLGVGLVSGSVIGWLWIL
ncbi:PREDICTED: equilibrative nucleotide transporter 8 [Fragaria vesca subsp. vesca]|uniref:equilibrative nucleotide transporter 8 n=1 Tax=Fragaria vesca subsp. vesca TaxID=101020 RepID=UPI0002C34FEB|nr:PREDICTED: equilibrative nucleotide transporter 8 [Fragaria vesca subsp. vesca]